MSEKKIIYCYCDSMKESKEKYTEYINNHIKNVKEAYKTAIDAFKNVFPEIYTNAGLGHLYQLEENLQKHDKSKFDDYEFWAYAMRFFPIKDDNVDSEKIKNNFQLAWLHHIHNNPHHPAYWALIDDGEVVIFDMPDIYIIEMLCDWMAMSKYYGTTTIDYWNSDSAKMLPMSKYTVSKVNKFMDYLLKNNLYTL